MRSFVQTGILFSWRLIMKQHQPLICSTFSSQNHFFKKITTQEYICLFFISVLDVTPSITQYIYSSCSHDSSCLPFFLTISSYTVQIRRIRFSAWFMLHMAVRSTQLRAKIYLFFFEFVVVTCCTFDSGFL